MERPYYKQISFIVIAVMALVYTYKIYEFVPWKKDRVVINDVQSYYSYLPAVFIYQDLDHGYMEELHKEEPKVQIWWTLSEIDKPVQKMTCGAAVLYLPFFLTAHGIASITDYHANGYSRIYMNFIAIGAVVYAFLSMLLIRKILRRYFDDLICALCIICIFLGSNVYYYVIYEGGMTHTYNLFLFSCLIWWVIKWLDSGWWRYAVGIGFVSGLIVLIRPSNAVILLFPLLFGILKWKDFIARFQFFIQQWKQIPVMLLCTFSVLLLQLLYWKSQTGQWIHYSYDKETFYFLQPHIVEGLFSYRKGYYLYSPIMLFSLGGLYFVWGYVRSFWLSIVVIFPLYLWVIFSWWCWWYGGSFGNRAMVESSALMALPMGAFFQYFKDRKVLVFKILLPVIAFLLYLNIFQTYQFATSTIHYDSMTKEAYWNVFLKRSIPENTNHYELLEQPDFENAMRGKKEYSNWQKLSEVDTAYTEELPLKDFEADSILIKVKIHGNLVASEGNLKIILISYSKIDVHIQSFTINPSDLPFAGTNTYKLGLPFSKGRYETLKAGLVYTGKGKAYYQDLELR